MMKAERPSRAMREEMAREGFLRRFPDGAPKGEPPANAGAALLLMEADTFRVPYRGRVYELGHVSFEDGLRLIVARTAIEALDNEEPTEANQAAYLAAMRLVVAMAPRYLLPVRRVRRLFWRLHLRRNPFRKATDAEVGHILGFFLTSRMRSRVRYGAPAAKGLALIS